MRTSEGRIYCFNGNGGRQYQWDGYVEVSMSTDGFLWQKVSEQDELRWIMGADFAMDSANVVHMIAYDWQRKPYYRKLNTLDSGPADHSWSQMEVLGSPSDHYDDLRAAIVVDSNDIPHVVYHEPVRYKGRWHVNVYYANRAGGVWSRKALFKDSDASHWRETLDIAIGPDSIPYILAGQSLLKGNGNSPSAFEEVTVGDIESFVIHENGDVRAGLMEGTSFVHYLHDHTQPWTAGWTSFDSGRSAPGRLVIVNDVPYTVRLEQEGVSVQREFDDPVLAVSHPAGSSFSGGPAVRWSFFNHHERSVIDLGLSSKRSSFVNDYWYGSYNTRTRASFSGEPRAGLPPLRVDFADRSAAGAGSTIVSHYWDFNGDGITDSTEQNPSAEFIEAGLYTVSLTAADSTGFSDKETKRDYILVDYDTDSDGVIDTEDNCAADYNPTQVDLDRDGLGYACDDHIELFFRAALSEGLRSETATDVSVSDVSMILSDGLPDSGVLLRKIKGKYDTIGIMGDVDAEDLSALIMKIHVANGAGSSVRAYAYMADGVSVHAEGYLQFVLSPGWNELDLSALLPLMSGHGLIKVRLAADSETLVSEASLTGASARGLDDWTITVSPLEHDFGSVMIGGYASVEAQVMNAGTGDLVIGAIETEGQHFKIEADSCSGRVLGTGEGCLLGLGFTPEAVGQVSGAVIIPSNDRDNAEMRMVLRGGPSQSAGLFGTVRNRDTGQPISGAVVRVTQARLLDLNSEEHFAGNSCIHEDLNKGGVGTVRRFLQSCYNDKFLFNDEEKCRSSMCWTFDDSLVYLTSRNPVNTTDPIGITWNGVAGNEGIEVLGQEFRAGKTGLLTGVRLPLMVNRDNAGYVQVFLKKALGGDKDSILAASGPVDIKTIPDIGTNWIEFSFPDPAPVTEGETYYIELHNNSCGTDCNGDCIQASVFWLYDTAEDYRDGTSFARAETIWDVLYISEAGIQRQAHLAFATYIDGMPDVRQTSICCSTIAMVGINRHSTKIYIRNTSTGMWELLAAGMYQQGYDDITIRGRIEGGHPEYYGPGGQVRAALVSRAMDDNYVSIDQLLIGFERTREAVTGGSGQYTLDELVPTMYDAEIRKPGYVPQSIGGLLQPGEIQQLDVSLEPAPPLILTVTTPAEGTLLTSTPVEVRGTRTNDAVVTVDGEKANVFSGGFYWHAHLTEGENVISVTAADKYDQVVTREITVTYTTRGSFSGTVRSSISEAVTPPLPGAVVTLTDAAGIHHSRLTGEDGSFVFNGLPAGYFTYEVSAEYHEQQSLWNIIRIGQTTELDVYLVPSAPVISTPAADQIGSDTVTISWNTDLPTAAILEYGETAAYGSTVTDTEYKTGHSVTLTGLTPSTTCHFRITATSGMGRSAVTGDYIFTTAPPPAISLTITSPLAGETVLGQEIRVQGTVVNRRGLETGVTVNGASATISGESYFANNIVLGDGENILTVKAVDAEGNTAEESVSVDAIVSSPCVRLMANIESGVSTLEVYLRLDGTFSFEDSSMTVSGPGPVELLSATVDEYVVRMTDEGIYYFTAEAADDEGTLHDDTVAVIVLNREQLDALLKSKWEGMKEALMAQDIPSATNDILRESQSLYNAIYSALIDQLPQLIQGMQDIQLIYAQGGTAKYRLRKNEFYGTGMEMLTYYIYFVIDRDGLWKIYRY